MIFGHVGEQKMSNLKSVWTWKDVLLYRSRRGQVWELTLTRNSARLVEQRAFSLDVMITGEIYKHGL